MRKLPLIFTLVSFPALAAPAAPESGPYASMAFLAGSCWKGDLPAQPGQGDVKQTDEHCFTWVYGGRFLRDRHVVHADNGRPDYVGETVYYWDAPKKQIEYLYFENQGGVSQGAVQPAADTLVFPATDYIEDGKPQTYRSHWQHAGSDAYDVVTEFKEDDGWKPAWTVRMKKTRAVSE